MKSYCLDAGSRSRVFANSASACSRMALRLACTGLLRRLRGVATEYPPGASGLSLGFCSGRSIMRASITFWPREHRGRSRACRGLPAWRFRCDTCLCRPLASAPHQRRGPVRLIASTGEEGESHTQPRVVLASADHEVACVTLSGSARPRRRGLVLPKSQAAPNR